MTMFDRLLAAFSSSGDVYPDQDIIGYYLSLSIWLVSVAFSAYYLAMGIDVYRVGLLLALALVGIVAARLFKKNKNMEAVVIQGLLMMLSLIDVITFPVLGVYVNICVIIIAINPIVLLREMHYGIIFTNFVICVAVLSASELMRRTQGGVLEEIFDFFIKFMVLIFVFFQAYALRLMLEKRR
ncbi:hypothetical protein QJS83_15785 [Bdellovibrio sp. 22V]|uniref:hypothetical protein n=1 Tax=Bdellovibrio TaxID=958 RepID=UPI002543AF33|nr:hypothetical protein [Bdellovibrio sp. 22V]WII71925.1 hypothetical protein QJS83_15785 [Bdellovibrio sp. 22V]